MRMIGLHGLVFLLISLAATGQEGLLLNEMMSDNETTIEDGLGDYSDWIEIYNSGSSPIGLNGFFLSDDSTDLLKWTFPDLLLQPQDFVLVFASGKDTIAGQYIHTNFKIAADGEGIWLANNQEEILDYFPPVELNDDQAYGRRPDGTEAFFIFDLPTPGSSNNLSNSLTFSHNRGYYNAPFNLSIASDDMQANLRYTTDGSIPGPGSDLYTVPLYLDYRYGDANGISMIPTTPDSANTDVFYWKAPVGNTAKIHTLRVQSYVGNIATSRIYTQSYFVDSVAHTRYTFPIVSLVTDPGNLFDSDTGIYIPGVNWNPEDPWWTGNYFQKGMEWERNLHFEMFDVSGEVCFYQDAGVRIKGKSTRRRPQKSLKISARSTYGKSTFDYPIFPDRDVDSYKSFLLENTFGDQAGTIIKDVMTHQLVRPLGLDILDYRPVVVFINGEYWGFQNLREDADENYLASLYDISKDDMNVLENQGSEIYGIQDNYIELLDYIEQNDMSVPAHYEYVTGKIDIENYINYQIAEIYLCNYDWPGSNIAYWQSPDMDDRWRWIFYDLDFAYLYPEYNMLEHATLEGEESWPNPDWSTFLFRSLLLNEEFKNQFIDRFAELMGTLFTPQQMLMLIDSFIDQYQPELQQHIDRYGYPTSEDQWLGDINYHLKKFAEERPCIMEDQIILFFELEEFGFDCDSNSIPSYDNGELKIAPNPSSGDLYFQFETTQPFDVNIVDLSGRYVHRSHHEPGSNQRWYHLDVTGLISGLYILELKQPDYSTTSKLVISK